MLYCRVDGSEMGNLVDELGISAEAYLEDAGCVWTPQNAAYYALAVKAMTLHYLDNPGGAPTPQGLRNLINKLKFTPAASGENQEVI